MYERRYLTTEKVKAVYTEALTRLEMEKLLAHVNALMAVDTDRRREFEQEFAVTGGLIAAVEADGERVLAEALTPEKE